LHDGQLRHVGDVPVVLAKALAAVAAAIAVATPGSAPTRPGAQPREVPVIQSSAVHVAELDEAEARLPAAVVMGTRELAVEHRRARVHLLRATATL
jgi:hypothetical protein